MHIILSKLRGFVNYYFRGEGSEEIGASKNYHNRQLFLEKEERQPFGDGEEDCFGTGRGDGIGSWEGDNLEIIVYASFILEESDA
jgi:hypothetical protein